MQRLKHLSDVDRSGCSKNECNEYEYAPHCFVPFGVWKESTWDVLPKASWGQCNTFSGRGAECMTLFHWLLLKDPRSL